MNIAAKISRECRIIKLYIKDYHFYIFNLFFDKFYIYKKNNFDKNVITNRSISFWTKILFWILNSGPHISRYYCKYYIKKIPFRYYPLNFQREIKISNQLGPNVNQLIKKIQFNSTTNYTIQIAQPREQFQKDISQMKIFVREKQSHLLRNPMQSLSRLSLRKRRDAQQWGSSQWLDKRQKRSS